MICQNLLEFDWKYFSHPLYLTNIVLSDYHSQEDQKRKSTRVVFTEKNKNFCEYGIMKLPEKCSNIFIKIISPHQGNKATKMQGY